MSDCFSFHRGDSPLLISIPHDGRRLAPGMEDRMTDAGRALPDTDWHVIRLYKFAKDLGASIIAANYSRYVVDLNRSNTDAALYEGQVSTGLCPQKTFAGDDIYVDGDPLTAEEQQSRIVTYWRPYHDRIDIELQRIRAELGYALLWDAHSIPSRVPMLFDGELPVLNIGTNGGESCDSQLQNSVVEAAEASSYSIVVNGRFRGGYITRYFGQPDESVHAIQLELAQRAYMDEETQEFDDGTASRLVDPLSKMLQAYSSSARSYKF